MTLTMTASEYVHILFEKPMTYASATYPTCLFNKIIYIEIRYCHGTHIRYVVSNIIWGIESEYAVKLNLN